MLIEEIHYVSIEYSECRYFLFILSLLQFCTQDNLTFSGRLQSYFRDRFKTMTLVAFILFYVGLIVRFTYASSEEDFIAARFVSFIRRFLLVFVPLLFLFRVIMAIDIELWWLRLLSFIIVIRSLGPYLEAIFEMVLEKYLNILCFREKKKSNYFLF